MPTITTTKRRAKEQVTRVINKKKKKAISPQLEQIDFIKAQLLSVNELNDAVNSESDQEALFIKKQFNVKRHVIPVEVKDNNDGSVSCVVKQVGGLNLLINIEGNHIKGSSYTVMVQPQYYETVNKPRKIVNDDGNMGKPWGIVFGKDGVWAMTDSSNHCVYMFDSQDMQVD